MAADHGFNPDPEDELPEPPASNTGYVELERVLNLAVDQAANGKGKERHAITQGVFRPFHEQPICSIGRMAGVGYTIGQAMKKGHEACELPRDRALTEILGAINYLAASYILIEEKK
tara:strand:+ start:1008 stop:1358 length:351 start_codon:yes stop_codon:yes gene_type:complete